MLTYRLVIHVLVLYIGLVMAVGTALAEPQIADDAQPGFGFLLALVAIIVAMLIARYKRQNYLDS